MAILTASDYAADGLGGIEHVANPTHTHDVRQKAFAAPPGGRIVEMPHFPLARGRVRHVGEAVAAVIAESAGAARDAAERIEVAYAPLPAVVSPLAALGPGAPQLWKEVPRNLCFELHFGDAARTESALARAACVVRHDFVHNRVANGQLEPRAALGEFDAAAGLYTLRSGSQGVSRQQAVLAAALRVPAERVRVISPDVGGGFGARSNVYAEQLVVLWAAKRLGRPVKWTGERTEAFVSDYQGRDGVTRAALAFDADGRILGYDLEHFGNVGAYPMSYVPMGNGMRILSTVYHVPAAHLLLRGALTNTVPTGPYRGAGRPEMTHVVERLLDIGARRMKIDRAEIRRRNLVRREMLPYTTAMGLVYESGDFPACMERALAAADWAGFAQRRDEARSRGMRAGIGVANHVAAPVGAPGERIEIRIGEISEVEVISGTQSSGQGHETSLAQVVADALGVPIESVRLHTGDTAFVRHGGGTHSDRSMRIAGALLAQVSRDLIEKGRKEAARRLEASETDLVFEEGSYRVAGTDKSVALLELGPIDASGEFSGRIPAHPAGAAACELEVDAETGTVRVTRYTTCDDVGQPVNPMIVEGQAHGGITQGIGQALLEDVAYDAGSGQPIGGSFMDYALPRAEDLPDFAVGHFEDPLENNPLRVKGAGEGGTIPASAAVINALCDALGVEDVPMPATPEKVWKVLQG